MGFYVYISIKLSGKYDRTESLLEYFPKDIVEKRKWRAFGLPGREALLDFVNFPVHKGKNVIRIGAFGDSHTEVSEVGEIGRTESYPRQLQELFNKNFPGKKVEVISFGVGADGFQDQFLLWEQYAEDYGLDYILLGPRGFYPERDFTAHAFIMCDSENQYFAPPKERYILSGENGVEFIHNRGRKADRFIPSWKSLRYDKGPFLQIGCFFPYFKNLFKKNPFYYTDMSMNEESSKINKILLKKIKDRYDEKILFVTDWPEIFKNYKSVQNLYNINIIDFERGHHYWMAFAHASSLENELLANVYFNSLVGNKSFDFDIINCRFNPLTNSSQPTVKNPHVNLDSVKSIKVFSNNNIELFSLASSDLDFFYHDFGGSYDRQMKKEIKNFLAFWPSPSLSLPRIHFSIPFSMQGGEKIFLKIPEKKKIELGSITPLDSHGVFFIFRRPYIFIPGRDEVYFRIDHMLSFMEGKKITMNLFIEDYELGVLKPIDGSFKFSPAVGFNETFAMQGPDSNRARVDNFPDRFSLYAQYNMKNGEKIKSPMPSIICKKDKQRINLKLPNFTPLYSHSRKTEYLK